MKMVLVYIGILIISICITSLVLAGLGYLMHNLVITGGI